jgi:hypothetical protein
MENKIEKFMVETEKEATLTLIEKLERGSRKVVLSTDKSSPNKSKHFGYRLEIKIPSFFPAAEILYDTEKLLYHAKNMDLVDKDGQEIDGLLCLLQAGWNQFFIDVWATARPKKTRQDGTGGDNIHSAEWPLICQERVNAYRPSLAPKPASKKQMTAEEKAAEKAKLQAEANIKAGVMLATTLKTMGKSSSEISALVMATYPGEVSDILDQAGIE